MLFSTRKLIPESSQWWLFLWTITLHELRLLFLRVIFNFKLRIFQEHQILKEERLLTENLHFLEKAERIRFSELSNTVRDSHEKERAQAEKTKYWFVQILFQSNILCILYMACYYYLSFTIYYTFFVPLWDLIIHDSTKISKLIIILGFWYVVSWNIFYLLLWKAYVF